MKCIPKVKTRNAFPGDRAVIFTEQAVDVAGNVWPKGTELVPKAGGFDSAVGRNYQEFMNGARFEA